MFKKYYFDDSDEILSKATSNMNSREFSTFESILKLFSESELNFKETNKVLCTANKLLYAKALEQKNPHKK
ncbi:hypothetical protein [Fructilactobacillus florum]|uniref:hypothetical protein n=1 Tax=Fructilactobacillus florum TaxID=640331 RepID=UPI000704FB47|nr:hypothetical protein [Fructilactobacillus florum]